MEFVMVAVPSDRVLEVYALLAGGETSGQGSERSTTPLVDPWDQALLKRAYRESPPPMKAIFEHLSEHAGRAVGADELSGTIDRTRQQMAGVLGAFGRRVKSRYSQTTWPFQAEWNGTKSMWFYSMKSEKAEVIRHERTR